MTETAEAPRRRGSRFWLFAPSGLLLLLAVAWSAAWFVVRARAGEAIDAWFAREANAGRTWTCENRALGGYPFRVELSCSTLRLQRGSVSASLGRVEAVAQVYQPRHLIAEIEGPLRWTDGEVTAEGSWRLLETSLRTGPNGFQRASLVAHEPNVHITGLGAGAITLAAQGLEGHLRPNPTRPAADSAVDLAISARQARIPALEPWIGNPEPVELQADTTITQAQGFSLRPLVAELERWREAGGLLDLRLLSAVQGSRRLEARGELRLDETHRPAGQIQVSGTDVDRLMTSLTGGRVSGAEGLLGALLGAGREPASQLPAGPRGPTVRLEGGRVFLGPFPIPGARLPSLY